MRSLTPAVALLAVILVAPALGQVPATQPLPKVRIDLAGDSTVTPDAGWGNGFAASLSDRAEVTNLSRGGRSSKSFVNEGLWQKVLDDKPDYVLIQFGHNDQKTDAARSTDPATTYRQYLARYVDTARAAGIRPVLVTSVSRRQWDKNGSGKIESTLRPYAEAARAVAKEKGVPLIDLHEESIAIYEKLGRAETETLAATKPATAPSDDPADHGARVAIDGTHFNAKGSALIGRVVAEDLARVVPALAPYVRQR